MRDFRELKVWQKAHELTLAIYQETGCFPRTEMYGLTSQLRRAAVATSGRTFPFAGNSPSPGKWQASVRVPFARPSTLENPACLWSAFSLQSSGFPDG